MGPTRNRTTLLLLRHYTRNLWRNGNRIRGDDRATSSTSVCVCVTGASGFIGSWLVMSLLQRGYCVRATLRDPGNEKKVNHLLNLPNASTHLSLWKADLNVQGSFDDAIHGCQGVFHVATPMEFTSSLDLEDKLLKSTVDGVLNIMRSCSKAKTVKRFIFTSTIATINVQPQQPVEYNESFWTDVDFCKSLKIDGSMYCVAKTMAEKSAWKYAEENGLAMVTVHPSLVIGPFLIPSLALSIETAISLFTRNEVLYTVLNGNCAVHVDDVCNAHIYLFEHPLANGRYICSSHNFNIFDIAKSLSLKYPENNIPTEFDGFDMSKKAPPCSSKKLMDLGFEFAYITHDVGELCAESIEFCKHKGLL